MKFLLKKVKKFLSASLVMSSLCLSPLNQVSARLEGRIATKDDFDKFTSELEKIFEKCDKTLMKDPFMKCDEALGIGRGPMGKDIADRYYEIVKDGKGWNSLAFSCTALRILEEMGIQSGVVIVENSRGPIGGDNICAHNVVIYPLKNESGKIDFVVVDTIEAFYCYFNKRFVDGEKGFLDDYKERKFKDSGKGLTLSSWSWKALCNLPIYYYLNNNAAYGWTNGNPGSKDSVFVNDFDSYKSFKMGQIKEEYVLLVALMIVNSHKDECPKNMSVMDWLKEAYKKNILINKDK